MGWGLFIELSLLFIDVCLGGAAREEGGGGAETVAVLGRRERVGRIFHRANVLDNDVAVVDVAVVEAQVGADVACACRQVPLVELHDDAHVVAVHYAGR